MLPVRIDGIDVYQFDNFPSWQVVADQGPWFCIVKVADDGNTDNDGTNFFTPVRQEDSAFRKLWTSARDAGLVRGVYHFFRPQAHGTRDMVNAKCQQVIGFIEAAGGVAPGDLPPAIDVENRGAVSLDHAGTTDVLNQIAWWLDIMKTWWATRTGHNARPIIYTGNFWREGLVAPMIDDPAHPATPGHPAPKIPDPHFRPGLDNPPSAHTTPDGLTVNFGDFPLWMAAYTGDPETCVNPNIADPNNATLLHAVSLPNPWLNGPTFAIWQYSHCGQVEQQGAGRFLDVSVMASIEQVANARGLPSRLAPSTDATPLLKLAGVAPAPGMLDLRRVDALSRQPPDQVFSVLLLGQGFWPSEFDDIVDEALNGLLLADGAGHSARVNALKDIAPFNLLGSRPWSDRVACYYHACTDGDHGFLMRLRQTARAAEPDRLTRNSSAVIGAQIQPQLDSLQTFLGKLQVKLDDGTAQPATKYWPAQRRTGLRGSLIVVLRKPEQSWSTIPMHQLEPAAPTAARTAELYTIDPTTDDPVPFVAVNVLPGANWPALVARAIAQNLGALGDEYELDAANYDKPPATSLPPDPPNLITISDADRQQLLGSGATPPAKPQGLIVPTRASWLLPMDPAATFVSHDDPSGGSRPANYLAPWTPINQPYTLGSLQVVEGGEGYRHNTLRSDLDCLMRRMPAEIADTMTTPSTLPLQSDVPFCSVCTKRLKNALDGGVDLKIAPRILLASQRIEYDRVPWLTPKPDQPRTTKTLTAPAVTGSPSWSCTVAFDNTKGVSFTDVQLQNPAFWDASATADIAHVLKSVTFTGLSVTFIVGTGAAQTVQLKLTDALGAARPRNRKASPPRLDVADQGETGGANSIGARLSLCWEIADPAGKTRFLVDAVLSLVLRAPSNDADPSGAVTACRLHPQLSMRFRDAVNGVKVTGLHGKVVLVANNADASNLTGTLRGIAGGKLNASLFTESNNAPNDSVLAIDQSRPALTATSGRKLAMLRGTLTNGTQGLLPLPDWSWRYDYALTQLAATKRFAAVHDVNESGFAAGRTQAKAWPTGQTQFQATIQKLARQGAYDGVYVHPDLGSDGTHPIVPAPWCGELGLHLFWRRGLSVAASPSSRHDFAGWGGGRVDQGRGAVRGAPLVPPNQHVDVEVAPAAGGATVQITYEVTTSAARSGQWEVFLEQGLAYGLRYAVDDPAGGLTSRQLTWLASAVGVGAQTTLQQALDAVSADPVKFDAAVRTLVRQLFSHARWFDAADDGGSGEQVPTGDATLEAL